MKKLGWLILVLSVGCGGGGDTGVDGGSTLVCTAIGCGAPVSLRSQTLALTEQQIRGSTITVCRNQACYMSSFAGWKTPTLGGGNGISFPDPAQRDTLHTPLVNVVVWSDRGGGGFRFEVAYSPWSTEELHDGDTYDVTVTASDGTKLVDGHPSVNYVIHYPNGEQCPPACHSATAEL